MKAWQIVLLVLVVAVVAFFLGRYFAALSTAYKNRDKLAAALDIAGGAETLFGK